MEALVKCAYEENSSATLLSYYTLTNSADVQLKPLRGQKTQMDFVVISNMLKRPLRTRLLCFSLTPSRT